MVYLFENQDNKASVIYDGKTLSEDQKSKAIIISNLPEKQEVEGKTPVLKCKKSTSEVWYEYEDIQQSYEQVLQERISALEIAMANMMGV